ncbi:MAG: hypothetical protein QOG64_2586 [Acidimicrobiaceae bacterium]|nr:hypothetical protein [Acidimicrobiaceae bacterium]
MSDAFVGVLAGHYRSAMLTLMIDLGHRTGLFMAATEGPATSQELADRAGLSERHVREWLGALTTGGIIEHDPETDRYSLAAERAAFLTGGHPLNLAPMSAFVTELARHVGPVAETFRTGGGLPYSAYAPEFTTLSDTGSRTRFDASLVDGYLAAPDGLRDRLEAGVAVADVGCGTGHAVNVMARAFPRSQFTGYDLSEAAIGRARAEAEAWSLDNARFEVRDALDLPVDRDLALVTAFDTVHDQADPAGLLRRIREALAPDGVFLMVDIKAASTVDANLGHPMGPWLYGISVLHCMQVSLAAGGAGLGTVWGEQLARRMLAEAGFGEVKVTSVAGDRVNLVYVATPAG